MDKNEGASVQSPGQEPLTLTAGLTVTPIPHRAKDPGQEDLPCSLLCLNLAIRDQSVFSDNALDRESLDIGDLVAYLCTHPVRERILKRYLDAQTSIDDYAWHVAVKDARARYAVVIHITTLY
jgi:hypothetical protein